LRSSNSSQGRRQICCSAARCSSALDRLLAMRCASPIVFVGATMARIELQGALIIREGEPELADGAADRSPDGTGVKTASPRARNWAALMHRAFGIDVLACAQCGDRLRLIATLHDPSVIRKILARIVNTTPLRQRLPPWGSPSPSRNLPDSDASRPRSPCHSSRAPASSGGRPKATTRTIESASPAWTDRAALWASPAPAWISPQRESLRSTDPVTASMWLGFLTR
jgi:hypothetical protein